MTKAKIVLISLLVSILALMAILFGVVFRVKKQVVKAAGEDKEYCLSISKEIQKSAGIKKNSPIFMLNKEKAITKIEKAHHYIKVVQIKTISPIKIEIKVRKRFEMFYIESNNKYYILDEDLKVLKITDIKPSLIQLNIPKLSITSDTEEGEFVGTKQSRKTIYNLFIALYEDALMDREQIKSFISNINFETGYATTGEAKFNRIILQTNMGVKMDIYKPEQNLKDKINKCFSLYNDDEFTEEFKTEGRIKVFLNGKGEEEIGYFKN